MSAGELRMRRGFWRLLSGMRMSKLTASALAGLAISVMLVIAGCGGAQHTTTVSAQQAQRQINCAQRMPSAQNPNPCGTAPSGEIVIDCGAGLATSSSCDFAHNVKSAYLAALKRYGQPPTGLTVTTNPVSCATSGSGWRCTSRINALSWVTQKP